MLFNTLLMASSQASGTPAEQPSATQSLLMFLPFILIIVVMYFVTIRPQKKREKELRKQLDRMKPGDKVMSIGGIVGTVANISGDEVTIYSGVASTMLTFKKNAISTVFSSAPDVDEKKDDKKEVVNKDEGPDQDKKEKKSFWSFGKDKDKDKD